ncbi:MAG TPA: glycosyltransferase family 4 protein [Planctomycetota bacterium]|nr:glycosyltransferase family 4 protein [Planctomycetota bacterium]
MRLFFVNMHRHWGGQSTALLFSASELAKRGHEVVVAGVKDSELMLRAAKAGLRTFDELELRRGFRLFSFLRDQRRLKKFWRSFKPEIILTNGSQDTWACGLARWSGFRAAKVVRWRHNSFAVSNHFFNRWLYRTLIDHVVVSSAAIAPILIENGLVAKERVTVFPPTTNLEPFLRTSDQPRGDALRRELALAPDGTLTISVGRLAPEKGYDTLIRAWRRVVDELPGAKLAIAGLGEQPPLKTIIDELSLREHVQLLGFRDDVPQLYNEADLAVLAPVAGESFGIALLEAYAAGRACVATDVGGVGDLVIDNVTGFLVKPRDEAGIAAAVVRCLKDAGLRERFACEGKARVLGNFTPEKLGDVAEGVFRKLISSKMSAT